MAGHVLHPLPVAVDFWYIRKCPSVKLFFLTHMHGDHIVGLTPSWTHHPIYCSPVTKKLLELDFQIKKPDLVISLEVNESHILHSGESDKDTLTVTVIDAHHCPGAVMFMFQGYFGTILYTGDFRYEPSMFIDSPLKDIDKMEVDRLYIDNTYNTKGCEFPTREKARDQIVEIIESHQEHRVFIETRKLGKEELFEYLAIHFQTRVVIDENKYEKMCVLQRKDVFTTEENAGRIELIPFNSAKKWKVEKWNYEQPTIVIVPTGLNSGQHKVRSLDIEKTFIVSYSDHSSFSELYKFVSKVKPCEVRPIVAGTRGAFHVNKDMTRFRPLLREIKDRNALMQTPPKESTTWGYNPNLQTKAPGKSCRNNELKANRASISNEKRWARRRLAAQKKMPKYFNKQSAH